MILLTGASGFLGQALAKKLGDEVVKVGRTKSPTGYHVVADLAEETAAVVVNQLNNTSITTIIHAAAVTPWSDSPDYSLDINMARSVAQLSDALAVERVYFLSGWNVYDEHSLVPFSETNACNPQTEYGASKLAVETYLNQHVQTAVINLRLASVYGPGQRSAGLIPNLVKSALTQSSIAIAAKETRRDYLYVDDFTDAVQDLLRQELSESNTINIGSGTSIAVNEVATVIAKKCEQLNGRKVTINYASQLKESSLSDNQLAIDKAHGLGLLAKTTPFEAGIQDCLTWSSHEAIL